MSRKAQNSWVGGAEEGGEEGEEMEGGGEEERGM